MAQFTDNDWKMILNSLSDILGAPTSEAIGKGKVSKLIAAIGYLADSEDPDRFAVSNLLTFYGAGKARSLFNHRPSDDADLYRRLATFHVGQKSDPRTVDYGLDLLLRTMLANYINDAAADAAAGKYNPVATNRAAVEAKISELDSNLNSQTDLKQTYSSIYTTDSAANGVWQ